MLRHSYEYDQLTRIDAGDGQRMGDEEQVAVGLHSMQEAFCQHLLRTACRLDHREVEIWEPA